MKIKVTDLRQQDKSLQVDVPPHAVVLIELEDGTRLDLTEVMVPSEYDTHYLMVKALGHNQSDPSRMAIRLQDRRTICIGREDS